MEKPIAAGRSKKFIIDVILGLLYILLLGYAFTGSKVHEIATVVFLAVVVVHNIVNIRWYLALNKGSYTGKRRLYTVICLPFIGYPRSLNALQCVNQAAE